MQRFGKIKGSMMGGFLGVFVAFLISVGIGIQTLGSYVILYIMIFGPFLLVSYIIFTPIAYRIRSDNWLVNVLVQTVLGGAFAFIIQAFLCKGFITGQCPNLSAAALSILTLIGVIFGLSHSLGMTFWDSMKKSRKERQLQEESDRLWREEARNTIQK
jgi:hypothetical protein